MSEREKGQRITERPPAKKQKKNVHENHRARVRKQFLTGGFDSLEDHVKLELLLYYALPQKDTNPLAHDLLHRFGSISGVFDAHIEELKKVDGVGENTAVLLKMIPPLARTYIKNRNDGMVRFYDNDSIAAFLADRYIGRRVETLMAMALDSKNRLLLCEAVNEGTIDTVPVYKRRIVEIAVRCDAASVILAHNHPSGNTMFSAEDIEATKEVYRALEVIGIDLMDHFLLVDGDYASMKAVGLLDKLIDEIHNE